MRFRNLVLFFILFMALFLVFAELAGKASASYNRYPPMPTVSASGPEMYMAYCAECHGRDGKGGPGTAVTFGMPVPNLTRLAKKNQGRFPYGMVQDAIRGEEHSAIYGPGTMPPWGRLFRYVGGGSSLEVELRIHRLTEYIDSLQEK